METIAVLEWVILHFKECTALITVSLPTDSNLVEISGRSFENCISLTSITIPSNYR